MADIYQFRQNTHLVSEVTATDASGNTTVAEAQPSGLGSDNDDPTEEDD